jgi:hypothetical protein
VEYAAGGIQFNGCGGGEKRNKMFEHTQLAKRKAEQEGGGSGHTPSRSRALDMDQGGAAPKPKKGRRNELANLLDGTLVTRSPTPGSSSRNRSSFTPEVRDGGRTAQGKRGLEKRVEVLQKKQRADSKTICALNEKIVDLEAQLASALAELQKLEKRLPDENEILALAALHRGEFEIAIQLFTRSYQSYEKMLLNHKKTDVKEGEDKMRNAIQQHWEEVAPEMCYGINGLSQNGFQRLVAIFSKHTVPESLAIAAEERAKVKKFKRPPRQLSPTEEQLKRDNASVAYAWLERVFNITVEDLREDNGDDYRTQLAGLGIQAVGIVCDDVRSRLWFSKAGTGSKYRYVEELVCEFQSPSSPKTVDEAGKVTNSTLDARSASVKAIFRDDPDKRPLCSLDHWWWPKRKAGG